MALPYRIILFKENKLKNYFSAKLKGLCKVACLLSNCASLMFDPVALDKYLLTGVSFAFDLSSNLLRENCFL